MIVPTYQESQIIDKEGNPLPGFISFLQNLIQNMNLSLSDEGFLIPGVSSEPNSSGTSTQLAVLLASFLGSKYYPQAVNPNAQTQTVGLQSGTLIFDPYEQNGGTPTQPLGQLKIILNDGSVHNIPNL